MTPELEPEWLPASISRPAFAPLVGVVGRRSRYAYLAILGQYPVETHARYLPEWFGKQRRTKCNVLVADATQALGCAVPWVLANEQVRWLATQGCQRYGWVTCDKGAAAGYAHRGWPTLAAWENPTPGESGHIAFVIPPPTDASGLWVCQAGAVNRASMPLASGFGAYPVTFFCHP